MNIFGINGNTGAFFCDCSHDSAIALISNGKLVDVIEEERLSRIKHDGSHFPKRSFKQIMHDHHLEYGDVDYFDVHDDHLLQHFSMLAKKPLLDVLGEPPRHHLLHAYETFYTSGFKDAAILVIDGYGTEGESISLLYANLTNIEYLKSFDRKYSLGRLYSSAVKHSGIASNGYDSVFKCSHLMSLVGYGKDSGRRFISMDRDEMEIIPSNSSIDSYDASYADMYPFKRNRGQYSVMHYANFAATIQANFNEVVLDLVRMLKRLVPHTDNLCLSGGCIQNGIANNLICESGLFKNVWASPMVADCGMCLGNAYYVSKKRDPDNTRPTRLTHPFFGREYTNDQVIQIADKMDLVYKVVDYTTVADLINQGSILGWFMGKSEIGPRALGHRSILANITNKDITNKISCKIKCREDWRPLASIFIDKVFDKVFDVKNKDLFNFMMRTTKVREEMIVNVQGACHVDYTALPQLVTKKDNAILYNLLDDLYTRYAVYGVLNTSLNDHDEPIIENPEQAMKFLIKTPDLDGIVFNGNLLVTRI